MATELLVRDVMIPIEDYLTVQENESIYQAIKTLKISIHHNESGTSYGHRALLVFNKAGSLTGILTLLDLLKAVEIKDHYDDPWIRSAGWSWYFIKRKREVEGITVKEVMRPIHSITINANLPIRKAVKRMFSQEENLIPVFENNTPIGIVRSVDLFWVIDSLL